MIPVVLDPFAPLVEPLELGVLVGVGHPVAGPLVGLPETATDGVVPLGRDREALDEFGPDRRQAVREVVVGGYPVPSVDERRPDVGEGPVIEAVVVG